jgi:hypothetical protein
MLAEARMEDMQAQQSHIGERQNQDVRLREQGVGRLEEAVFARSA